MIGDVRQRSCALQAGVADDPLGEDHDAAVPGLVHCYLDQVLFLATRFWSSYCRYCTRSRMVEGGGEYTFSASQSQLAIDHMAAHPEIRDVVLLGGDPLTIATEKLEWLLPRSRWWPGARSAAAMADGWTCAAVSSVFHSFSR
jgi:lysine 2,3-aminomutase